MATIKTIIDELETIADAFTSTNRFLYDDTSAINGVPSGEFPLIHIPSSPNFTRGKASRDTYMPIAKTFDIDIFVYDVYNVPEQSTTDLQTKQDEVDEILERYISEVLRRNLDPTVGNGFLIVNKDAITGFIAKNVHNQRLVVSKCALTFRVDGGCLTAGTFNY